MVDRKRLARGTKLVPGQIYTPLSTIGNTMNTAGVAVDTYQAPLSTFRVNLHIPYIASDYRHEYVDTVPEDDVTHEVAIPYGIPFTLPPLQEFFDTNIDSGSVKAPEISEDTPFYILDEVSFSFDQRGEPAAIADHFYDENATPSEGGRDLGAGSTNQGNLDYERATSLEVTISILEKTQHVFDSGNILPDREVFTATITPDGLTGRVLRFNPFIVTALNKTMSPYKTYIFTIYCPALLDPDGEDAAGATATLHRTLALVSVQASMKFSSRMVDRDKYVATTSEIQNIPKFTGDDVHDGAKRTRIAAGTGVAISLPAVNTVIHADQDGTGVNRNMNEIDGVFRDKLKGGYHTFGEPHAGEELKEDAGYEVIAVPLWQNGRGGGISVDQVTLEPHFQSAAQNSRLSDRRIIPIFSPISIHHVILAWNWSAWKQVTHGSLGNATSVINSSATFKVEAGVALVSGIGGDTFAYEDVANVTLLGPNTSNPSTWDQNLIDRIKIHPDTPSPTGKTGITASDEAWDWELHQMTIEGDADRPGYVSQGWPIWTGETVRHVASVIRGSAERRVMDNDGLRAVTFGYEQFIEVRGIISDSVGLQSTDSGAGTDNGIVVGYQGCWVYIIGKKHLL